MGCDPSHNGGLACNSGEQPLHTVFLDAYRIGETEVTNAEYAECVADAGCTPPAQNSSPTRPLYYGNAAYDNYPVIYVNWYQAAAYCTWAGRRLPTEAEWEKAARGSVAVRAYPWGDGSPTCELANYTQFNFSACVGDTSSIGSRPAGVSPYGAYDMAGNAWERVNDWSGENYYSVSPASHPPGPVLGIMKVYRGGSWISLDGESSLRTAQRNQGWLIGETTQSAEFGFRCAADALP
jgi:formylglycine-generating enzyme required for sulfatase activity